MENSLEKLIKNVFEKCEINKWYNTKGDLQLIENLKYCHELHGNISFSDDFSAFKKVQPFAEYIADMDNPKGINIKFEFHNREDVFIDYSHIEGNEPPFLDSRKTKRRAV